jgi:predicted PurR-regulated permease PerM
VLLTAAGAVLVVAGLHQIAGIIAPIFLALVLTVAVHPLDGMLRRWGAAPWAALTLTLATIYLILIFLVGAAAFSVARLATVLPEYKGRAQELVDNVSQGLSHLGIGGQQAGAGLSDVNIDKVVSVLLDVLDGLLGVTRTSCWWSRCCSSWPWTRPDSRRGCRRSTAATSRARCPASPVAPAATSWSRRSSDSSWPCWTRSRWP